MIPLPLLQDAAPSSGLGFMVPVAGMLLIMYLVVLLPERKARKKKEAMLAAIKKNDKVLLSSGMYATVAAVNEADLTVRFDDGTTRVKVLRSAIGAVIQPEGAPDEKASAS